MVEAETHTMLEYALGYVALGWWVLPLKPMSKVPDPRLVPKGVHDASNDPTVVRAWFTQYPDCNIGIALKKSGLVGVDVDPRNGGFETLELLEAQHGKIKSNVSAFTGGGGSHDVFSNKASISLPGTLGKGIDLKTDGYLVAPPSIHPSGKRYEWEASSDPLEYGNAPSPLPDWIAALGNSTITPAAAPERIASTRYISDAQKLELKEALSYIDPDDYHQWIDIGQTLKNIGAAGFGLWDTWSQRSDKYDARIMGKKWRSFAPNKLDIETIFYRAQQAGWVNPMGKAASEREQALRELVDKESKVKEYAIKAATPAAVLPFPVPMLDELATWICRTQGIKSSVSVQMTAFAIASIAASRLYTSEFDDSAHLYQLLCAPSIGELLPLHNAISQVMRDTGLRKMLREQRFTTPNNLYRTLMRSPATLWMTSDWGSMTAFAKRQSSGMIEHIQSLLVNCYAQKEINLDSCDDLGLKNMTNADAPFILRPALSMLAFTSEAMLPSSFSVAEIGRGAVDQFLFHSETIEPCSEPQREDTPDWLIQHMRRIRRLPDTSNELDLASIFNGNAELLPNQTEVQFNAKPSEHYPAFDALCACNRLALPLARTARVNLRRLSLVLAVFENPDKPIVSRAISDWAARFVCDRIKDSIAALNLAGGSDDGKASMYQLVLQSITQAADKGCTTSDLVHTNYKFRSLVKAKREELISQLIDDGMVVEKKNSNNKGTRLFAADFITEAGK